MKLFIANATKQNWNHHFRVLESNRPYFVQIPSGTQRQMPDSWSASQIEFVVKQLEKYGARDASTISTSLKNFPGLLYRTDRAISESQLMGGHEAVVDGQERRSAGEATKAALGFDRAQRDTRTKKRLVKVTEVEVKQDVPKNQPRTGNEVTFKVGVSEDGDNNTKLPD